MVECGDQHLERALRVHERRSYALDDGLEKRFQIALRRSRIVACPAISSDGIKKSGIQLGIGSIEAHEELEDLIVNLGRAGIGPIHLVDEHNRL